ncbi:MAG TPA: sugar ABC transporter permease [bacterium]|nr:sugar ABC transporter permease [bacterium]
MANVELAVGTQAHARRGSFTRQRLTFGYALLAPAIVYMAVLVGIPFFFSLYLSLSDASVGNQVARFVGFHNFVAIFQDSSVRQALRNTVTFTVVAGIAKALLGGMLGFLLIQEVRGRRLIRSLVVLPWTLPVVITALAWKWAFDPQFSTLNWVANHLHLMSGWPNWLGEPGLAMAAVIAVNVWRGFPFGAIVLMAGMSSVPLELLDSAKVDGASFFLRWHYIIVPIIAPILFVGLLFDTVFTLSDLSIVYLLTMGGPMNSTEILPTRAFEIGIQAGALGRGAAISLILFPILLPVVYFLLRTLRRREAL